MSLNTKRIVSLVLIIALAVAMFASCNVKKDAEDIVVLKIGDLKYTLADYGEIFSNNLYTYTSSTEPAEYKALSTTERIKHYQDYVYDLLVDQAVEDYLIKTNKLEEKLTNEDKAAIKEAVDERIKSAASGLEGEIKESSITLEELKKSYTLTEKELAEVETKTESEIKAAIAAKMSVSSDTETSDAAGSDSTSSDSTASDSSASDVAVSDTTGSDASGSDGEQVYLTEDEAKAALAEEGGFDSVEAWEQSIREGVEFDAYFTYYKPDAALKKYKEQEDFEDNKKSFEEEEKDAYLRETMLNRFILDGFSLKDDDVKKYFEDKLKEYKDLAASEEDADLTTYYNYLNDTLTEIYEYENSEDKDEEEEPLPVLYTAEGYYYVKHVLIKAEEASDATGTGEAISPSENAHSSDTTSSSDTAASDDTSDAAKIVVDEEVKAAVEAEIEAINNELETPAEKLSRFDALISKYGEDPGMQSEPTKTTGYLMGKGNPMVEEFSDAAEALYDNGNGELGAISGAVESSHGIHYIQLVKILPAQELTFEDVKDEIREIVLEEAEATEYTTRFNNKKDELIKSEVHKYEDRVRSYGVEYASYYFGTNASTTIVGG